MADRDEHRDRKLVVSRDERHRDPEGERGWKFERRFRCRRLLRVAFRRVDFEWLNFERTP